MSCLKTLPIEKSPFAPAQKGFSQEETEETEETEGAPREAIHF